MDGIEKIIGRINAAAVEDCAAIAQSAQQECDAIRTEYAQKVQLAYEKELKNGKRKSGELPLFCFFKKTCPKIPFWIDS